MGGMIFVLGVGGGLLYAGSAAGVGGGVGGVVLGGVYWFEVSIHIIRGCLAVFMWGVCV
ncbi:MAG: hypothetical protein QW688_07580 [Thermoprotei archaeon]